MKHEDTVRRKLYNARAQVVMSHPFFGALLLRQELVETTDVEALATNGKQLFYNRAWVDAQEMDHLHFACAHEALHPGLCHHTRRAGRDFELWNHACDFVINPILKDAAFVLPEGVLLRDDLRGLNAEAVYTRLVAELPPTPESDDHDADEGEGTQDDTSDEDGEGAQDDTPQGGSPPQGGGGKGDAQGASGKAPTPSFGNAGAVLDAPGTEIERQREDNDWKVIVAQAEAMAKGAGNLPGGLEHQLRALLDPRAPWQELLRRYMDQFANADYSWRSPNRRFVAGGQYLPSMRSEQMGRIAFVIDASGSMPRAALEQACAELQAIASELRPEAIDVIVHDTEIRAFKQIEVDEEIAIDFEAGGGTLFAPVCQFLNDAPDPYAVVIWFTDLYPGDWEAAAAIAPDAPVLWIDWENGNIPVPFGDEVITLPESVQ